MMPTIRQLIKDLRKTGDCYVWTKLECKSGQWFDHPLLINKGSLIRRLLDCNLDHLSIDYWVENADSSAYYGKTKRVIWIGRKE